MRISQWLRSAACLAGILTAGCVAVDVGLGPGRHAKLQEVTLREPDTWTRNRILVLDISGMITLDKGGTFSRRVRRSPDTVAAMLRKAEKDARVKAVIIRIESPGGSVTATDMIYHEIMEFRRRTKRPVSAVLMGTACSGGYYAATAAQRIYAHPTCVTGSIGVVAKFPQWRGLAGKVGVDLLVIKSGQMKDLGNPFREMPEEERAVLQELIDTFHATFLDKVVSGRPRFQSPDDLRAIADGRIYTAKQALDLGLIDHIAYLQEALDDAVREAGIRDARVITYSYVSDDEATLYSVPETSGGTGLGLGRASSIEVVADALSPGFYYLWLPGAQ